jgi:hypothetical protein
MLFRTGLLATIFSSIVLSGCDSVQFPGFSQPDEATAPRAEQSASVEHDLGGPSVDAAIPETPANNTSVTDASNTDPLPAPDPADATDTEPEDALAEYAGITNLLAVNAARCAPSGEETQTLAEIANAETAAASVTVQAVNGTEITADTFPGIVKMEPRRTLASGGVSSGHCGATRIANNWFVTASHCLDDSYDEIRLIATQSNLRDPRAITFQATASLCHSAYGGASGQYSNDVALIGISDETAASLTTVPIARFGITERPLGPVNYPTARMAGWGLTSFERGQLSDTLLQADLELISSGPASITVASTESSGPCIGDSGGPLLIDEADGNPRVIGVLSVVEQNRATGEFCKGDYNARYTNLAGFMGWMETVIGTCTANPALCAR